MAVTDYNFRIGKCLSLVPLFVFMLCICFSSTAQDLSITFTLNGSIQITAQSEENYGFQLESSTDGIEWNRASDHVVGETLFPISAESQPHALFRLKLWEIPYDRVRLVIIGDSTIANFNVVYGTSGGWGQAIPEFFSPGITIANQAQPGISTKLFLETPIFLNNLISTKPDFVMIHFGYMDAHSQRDHIRTTPEEFAENITTIIQHIRGIGGTPILCTPVATTTFSTGRPNWRPLLSDHSENIRELASTLDCYLMDIYDVSFNFFQEIGLQKTLPLRGSEGDSLHFNEAGAKAIAALAAPLFPPFLKVYQREPDSPQ